MRVVFDLPENIHEAKEISYFGWKSLALHADGTINVAWPMSWKRRKPELVSGMTGIEGVVDVYKVVGEYKNFAKKYHFRNLDQIKLTDIAH